MVAWGVGGKGKHRKVAGQGKGNPESGTSRAPAGGVCENGNLFVQMEDTLKKTRSKIRGCRHQTVNFLFWPLTVSFEKPT